MESTVIELSRYTASDTPSNSQWTNNISNSKKVSVNNNDIIQVKQCFIDTRQTTSGDIELLQDVEWTLFFGYYTMCHGIRQQIAIMDPDHYAQALFSPVSVDGQPYLLYKFGDNPDPVIASQTGKPLVDSFTIKIPAGIYTRTWLASEVSRQMQGNPTPQNITLNNLQFSSAEYTPQYDVNGNCISFLPSLPADPLKFISSFNKPLISCGAFSRSIPDPLAGVLLYLNNNTTVKAQYTPCAYHPFLKDAKYNQTYKNIFLTGTATAAGTVQSLELFNTDYTVNDGLMAGANQVALEYSPGTDNSNKFQFTYAHTPIINNNNQVTGIYVNAASTDVGINFNTPSKFFNCFSGIVFFHTFTNLSPNDPFNDPFFTQLGMSYNDIVLMPLNENPLFNINSNPTNTIPSTVPPATIGTGLESAIFYAKTTRNFNPLQNLSNNRTESIYNYNLETNGSTYSIGNAVFNTSTTTIPLNFSNEPVSSINNAGHYLVELICSYSNNEYINATQNYQVKAIVGTYYLSSDSFCLTNGPDSYIYQHNGEPINLSSITVRLLNPITKEEATNIGPNSTIYLMITKEPQPPQPPPQKK